MWIIPRIIINKILGHAQRSLPEECVGLLSGKGRTILEWHPLSNQLKDSRRFLADPTEQIQTLRQLRKKKQELVAIYHSHPHASTHPSPTDLQQAYYPEALYLIVSLQTSGRLEINGYLIQDGQPVIQTLTVQDGEPQPTAE